MAVCAASPVVHAEPRTALSDGAAGTIEFRSYTPASQRPLITRSYLSGPPIVVSGILSLPKAAGTLQRNGRNPAVTLLHGTGGISDEREGAWAKRLNSWGIAAFVVDSYTGRGIRPPNYADSPKFTHFVAHLLDAYFALELLSTHPKIDGARVAIMGFSRGGETSVNAVFERLRVGALGDAPNRFAAYVPFYPYCNFRHVGKSLATAPMLMLLGGADEMDEPAPCERLAAWLKGRGVPVLAAVLVPRDRLSRGMYSALDDHPVRRAELGNVVLVGEHLGAHVCEDNPLGPRGTDALDDRRVGEVPP
jgi:dienelactone hydrolase